jgi:hypothetical protein
MIILALGGGLVAMKRRSAVSSRLGLEARRNRSNRNR